MLIGFLEKLITERKKSKIYDEKIFILVMYLSNNEVLLDLKCSLSVDSKKNSCLRILSS
jgi:hypothetical protein